MPKLCLNMIVKNEADRIGRCLNSVLPHVSCGVILDTGSTDKTVKIIKSMFKEAGKPVVVVRGKFKNFEQARNDALHYAAQATFAYDWLLLCDADMELMVQSDDAFDSLHGLCMEMIQKAGAISYNNVRLLKRGIKDAYKGVTHEYVNVPVSGTIPLHKAYFLDHADGSNRANKCTRDVMLLLEGLKKEPDNARYMFYLAQSYRDLGKHEAAAKWYKQRVLAGGWDEEVWNAQCNLAHSLKDMGDEGGFIRETLGAYNRRPQRAETLYDLAKHFREKGDNATGLIFAKFGMDKKRPDDKLFVNDYVYNGGLKQEYIITAYYDDNERLPAGNIANQMALDPKINPSVRDHARSTLYWYLEPLSRYCPSFKSQQIDFTAPPGYNAMNPTICRHGDGIYGIIRTVNYTIRDGVYYIRGTDGTANNTNPINTRNFLVRFSPDLKVEVAKEIVHDLPVQYPLVTGLEDMRIFDLDGGIAAVANIRQCNPEGWCEQHFCRLTEEAHVVKLSSHHAMTARPRQTEKNWMPITPYPVADFVYRLGETVDVTGHTTSKPENRFATENMSGGSQVIPFRSGYLALVHEAFYLPGKFERYYQHRFVYFSPDLDVYSISKPFFFQDKVIEFAAGLCWHPDKAHLLISYGFKDEKAMIAQVRADDVLTMVLS